MCAAAAAAPQQLEEAKKDLTAKGFNFKAGEKSE